MKKSLIAVFFLIGISAFSQTGRVGINTETPQTTLDISGKKDTNGDLLPTDMTGLQAPRLTRAELTAKGDALYGTNQKGALIYITDVSGGDFLSQRINVTSVGYYYFDGTEWKKMSASSAIEPWYVQGGTNQATSNTDHIYQNGRVGIGNFATASSLLKQLEVKGDFKAQVSGGGNVYGMEIDHPLIPGTQTAANYWLGGVGSYRVNLVHSGAAVLTAGLAGVHESIIATDDDRVTLGSRMIDLVSKSEIRSEKTGQFFMEAYNNGPTDYGATVSLLNDGLRLVHSTTEGAGANWLSSSNRSEIMVQKATGVRFNFKNSSGSDLGNYWFPLDTGTDGQVLTQTSSGRMAWMTPAGASTTTNTLANPTNTITSVVNGVSASASAVNTVSNTVSGGNVSTTVNGVAGTAVAISNVFSSSTNTLSSTVAGGTARTAPIINTNALGLSGTNLTSTINGIASTALNLGPAITAGTTHTFTNPTNTITSVVNGVSVSAPAVNTVSNTVSGGNVSTTVNGVVGTAVAINNVFSSSTNTLSSTVAGGTVRTAPIINTNVLGLSGTNLTSTINGIASTALNLGPAITAGTTNTLTAANGNLVSTVNGVANTPAVSVLISASSGLTPTNGDVKLGGTLAQTTTIATINGATTHPLNITGLPTGIATDNIVVSSTGGQLKTISTANLVREPWNVIGSAGTQATTNVQNIYQMGNVSINKTTATSFTVGVATINPRLHVEGDVSTSGKYYTTNSTYADYVFEKYFNGSSTINPNYEFKSLNYVRDFIKANNHLPGVESINDLAKTDNGYTFDMTKLGVQSLEKIEELYLHTIEQQDKIDAQQVEINQLKKEAEETKQRLEKLEKLLVNN